MQIAARQIRLACQQASDRNIFIQRIPVQAVLAQLNLRFLFRRCLQQSRESGQRGCNRPSIGQADPQVVVVKSNGFWRTGHACVFFNALGLTAGTVRPKASAIFYACFADCANAFCKTFGGGIRRFC